MIQVAIQQGGNSKKNPYGKSENTHTHTPPLEWHYFGISDFREFVHFLLSSAKFGHSRHVVTAREFSFVPPTPSLSVECFR